MHQIEPYEFPQANFCFYHPPVLVVNSGNFSFLNWHPLSFIGKNGGMLLFFCWEISVNVLFHFISFAIIMIHFHLVFCAFFGSDDLPFMVVGIVGGIN